jgi:antitoxin YefM
MYTKEGFIMTNTNATNLRKNLFEYLNLAIDFNDVINVNTKKGNAVILSEQEYNGLLETLYLTSIPGMKERLMEGIRQNPFQNPPPYEKLSGSLKELYSRRINRQHRLVYKVLEEEKTIIIISMWTHYEY